MPTSLDDIHCRLRLLNLVVDGASEGNATTGSNASQLLSPRDVLFGDRERHGSASETWKQYLSEHEEIVNFSRIDYGQISKQNNEGKF